MAGVLNEWRISYNEIWPESEHLEGSAAPQGHGDTWLDAAGPTAMSIFKFSKHRGLCP